MENFSVIYRLISHLVNINKQEQKPYKNNSFSLYLGSLYFNKNEKIGFINKKKSILFSEYF